MVHLTTFEDRGKYRPGRFHPVHLGDQLPDHRRYHVIHKLGNSKFTTVWLLSVVLSKKLVALKILMADKSGDNFADLGLLR